MKPNITKALPEIIYTLRETLVALEDYPRDPARDKDDYDCIAGIVRKTLRRVEKLAGKAALESYAI